MAKVSKRIGGVRTKSKYIEVRPDVQFGKPCVRGTRITIDILKELKKGGETVETISFLYNLSPEKVRAALNSKRKPLPMREVRLFYKKKGIKL